MNRASRRKAARQGVCPACGKRMLPKDVVRWGDGAVHRPCRPKAAAAARAQQEESERVARVRQIVHEQQEAAGNLRRMGVWLPS